MSETLDETTPKRRPLGEPSANLSDAEARRLVRSAEMAALRDVVAAFVERMAGAPDIAEAWLVQEADPLAIAVIVRDLTLDRDLELRAIAMDHDAELRVYDADEDRAALGRRGERLLG